MRSPLEDYCLVSAWAIDFVRALAVRPLWAKLLVRVVFGKYAYREFIGMSDALIYVGWYPFYDYSLEKCEYHKDHVPFAWWRERDGYYVARDKAERMKLK